MKSEVWIRWCLEHGADPHGRSYNGRIDVLTNAGQHASMQTLQLLVAYGADIRRSNALHGAAEDRRVDRVDVIHWLLDEVGILINQRRYEDDDWWSDMETPLHRAVVGNSPHSARVLLQRGADTSLRDYSGRPARDLALWLPEHDDVLEVWRIGSRIRRLVW